MLVDRAYSLLETVETDVGSLKRVKNSSTGSSGVPISRILWE